MKSIITEILNKKTSDFNPNWKINCFATVVACFNNQIKDGTLNAQNYLDWLQVHTVQVNQSNPESIFVIWTSIDPTISPHILNIHELKQKQKGYPFGLVMEHSGVFITDTEVFHKASPLDQDKFEIAHFANLITDYQSKHNWLRVTYHHKK